MLKTGKQKKQEINLTSNPSIKSIIGTKFPDFSLVLGK